MAGAACSRSMQFNQMSGSSDRARMLVILLLGCVASLRCGCAAFVQFPRMHGGSATTLRAAVYHRPLAASSCSLNDVIRLRRRAPPGGGVADSTMQLRTISPEFEPGMDTLVMKPQRGAVSAAAPFSGSTAPTEREKETEVPELRVRMLEAKEATKRGDYRAAEEMYSQLTAMYPTAGKVWMKRFNLARKQRFYGKAREVLQDSLKHNPCNAILWQAWADLERSLGRLNVARKLYHKGLEANPWLPSLYNSWGAMERECGRTDAARQLFREGLNHDGKSVRLLLSSGMLEDVEGNTEGARSLFRRGLLVEPGNSFLLHALGILEYKAGDVAAAREAFRAAVQANSDHTQSWLAWGQLEEAQGNVAIARGHYVQGCKARGGRGMVQLWQAWARMEEKHTNDASALEVYHKAVLLFPSDSKLWIECAKLLTKMGQHGKAITMLQRALDIDSYNPYTYQCLAKLEIKQGNYAEARRLFARGVAMAEAGLKVSLGSEGSDSSLREVLSGHGVADTDTGVSKHESDQAPGGGAGAARRKSARMPPDVQGSTVGRRELAALLHEWATFADSQGDGVNTTRAIFQKALELDSQRGFMWRSFAAFEGREGDPLVARHYFARAVNAQPHDGTSWSSWAKLEESLGNADRAALYARRGAELQSRGQMRSKQTNAAKPLARKWTVTRGKPSR